MRAVNLLPRDSKKSRKRVSLVTQLAFVAPVVVVSVLVAGYLLTSSKVNNNRATLAALQAELATLPPPPAPALTNNTQLAVERSQRIAALSSALQGRLVWDRVLRQVSAVLPGDVWLTTLSGQSPPPPAPPTPASAPAGTTATTATAPTTTSGTTTAATPAPPPAPATGPLTLAGFTYSQEAVARLLTRLAVVPVLQDVKLVSSSQTMLGGSTVIAFSIQAGVRPQETG